MKIALAQQNYIIGDFEGNRKKIIAGIREAKKRSADVVLFSELSVCGYPPRDFLEFHDFVQQCLHSIELITKEAVGIAALVGAPSINNKPEGKDLYNSAYFLYDGKVQQIVNKSLLPNYDVFDEYRYFEANQEFGVVEFLGRRIAFTVCEDLWNTGINPLYITTPVDKISTFSPDYMLNISASPFDYNHAVERINLLKETAKRYHLPIFYCNCVGAQTELIFDGGSLVISPNGEVFDEMNFFEEQLCIYDLDEVIQSKNVVNREQPKSKIPLIYKALVAGVREYFKKLNFQKAILGLSGGIDSAVVACIAVDALGKENVKVLLMPSQYSSEHSISDALQLVKNLQIDHEVISLQKVYDASLDTLEPYFSGKQFDVTEENLQARIRAMFLMSFCNKHHYILLNTSNKSEMAVGYGTLYGDMCGGMAVLGDVYKTEVYELVKYINNEKLIIPENIINKPPSAELRPDQKDSDSLPEYSILDSILYQYIEQRQGPEQLVQKGFERSLVERVLKMVNRNEHKRYQSPPILRISQKSFGSGRRLPIVAKYLS
ncbi:MAG: NAD+ synthase [Chitinophagales bacterium]|jgi:NAD+ synthase (glutamine-hydrolysing)|nr:NAD+ synthase [Chitinophagales bacterium]